MKPQDISSGMFGTLHFDVAGVPHDVQNVLLRFEPQGGAYLEWTFPESLPQTILSVVGQFPIGHIAIPVLRYVGFTSDFAGSRWRYRSSELFSSGQNPDPIGAEVTSASVPVPMLHEYVQQPVVTSAFNDPLNAMSWAGYNANSIHIPIGELAELNLRCDLNVIARGESKEGRSWTITPVPSVDLYYRAPAPITQHLAIAQSVKAFMEFIMYKANSEDYFGFTDVYDRDISYRYKLGPQQLQREDRSPWELPYSLCQEHLHTLLAAWLKGMANSSETDYLLRLLRYADLPIDMRFFMAFTALGQLLNTMTPGSNPRKPVLTIDILKAHRSEWKVMVPDASDVALDNYFKRIAATRNHFAHLSREGHEILVERKDIGRAMMQMVCIARTRMFKHMGLPDDKVKGYLAAVAAKLNDMYRVVPMELMS